MLDVEDDTWVVVDEHDARSSATARSSFGTSVAHDRRLRPSRAWGRGVGALLVGSLEAEARRRGGARVQTATLLLDERAQELLRGCGYGEIRRFWQMRIDLTEPPSPPTLAGRGLGRRPSTWQMPLSLTRRSTRRLPITGTTRRSRSRTFRASTSEHDDFDPGLCTVVRAGGEIVAGTRLHAASGIGVAGSSRLFTVRDWRGAGHRRGAARRRVRALLAQRPAAASGSASMRRATPAPSASTNAPACGCSWLPSSSRGRSHERAPRALPRLPHADGGRDRPRVSVPRVRPRVRGGSAARAARLG